MATKKKSMDINIGISYAVMLFFVVALGALGLWLLKRGTGLRS
jgi:ABC-2 type transport system permease protein